MTYGERPAVSVIMPVFNGASTLETALGSLVRQTTDDWELCVVDDASYDETPAILAKIRETDERIRVNRREQNLGPSAARTAAIAMARGRFIAYLDADDEFYPDYLQRVIEFGERADLLFFGYDFVSNEPGANGAMRSWDPTPEFLHFFGTNLSTPLGVAHRRELIDKVGGFDWSLWQAEDWDLWRRMARSGAEVLFLPFKSGIYHIREGSRSRKPRVTELQRELYEGNRKAGRPLYEKTGRQGDTETRRKDKRTKLLFAASCCLLDANSGAAIATQRMLAAVGKHGCKVEAFCLGKFDADEEVVVEEALPTARMLGENERPVAEGRWLRAYAEGVKVTVARTRFTRHGQFLPEEIPQFLNGLERHLAKERPDVVLTYGGDPVGFAIVQLARRRDIPIVFALHNFAYNDVNHFQHVDYVIVPSHFSRRHYWRTLGVHAMVLPNVIDPAAVVAHNRQPKFVIFVNPQPTKGVFVFARIAAELSRRRPDIPLLVVESRGRAKEWLEGAGIDLSRATNLFFLPNTPDPRQIYAVSRLILMPSLWCESFGLVAAEAMANGIPVLASNRGALPEIVGVGPDAGGFLFDVPAKYTPDTTAVPTAEEVEPWLETIIRLWDDSNAYFEASILARGRARRWHPDVLGPKLAAFFRAVTPQPNPPFVPQPWEIPDEPEPEIWTSYEPEPSTAAARLVAAR